MKDYIFYELNESVHRELEISFRFICLHNFFRTSLFVGGDDDETSGVISSHIDKSHEGLLVFCFRFPSSFTFVQPR